jgi:signal transduction histidine kinase
MSDASVDRVIFRPKARLLYIVGGDLIKDEMAGIIELVKNAYDADASKVTISLRHLDAPKRSDIVITDDGHGMSMSAIQNGWLSPATENKGQRKSSPGGRPMQGRKGVGRFSAMRLGDGLLLDTTPGSDAPEQLSGEIGTSYRINLDWNDFVNSVRFLDEVEVNFRAIKSSGKKTQGTKLIITKLRDEWTVERIERLYRELRMLLSPLGETKETDFKIIFDLRLSKLPEKVTKRFDRLVKPIPLPEITDYTAVARISANGNYRFTYERKLWAEQDRGDIRKSLPGADIRTHFSDDDKLKFPPITDDHKPVELPCGPLEIRIHIWDRDAEILEAKVADPNSILSKLGMRRARQFLNEISGMAIYRDQFRVRPYGDEDKDWMGLGQRRVQHPATSIGPNQLFGIVHISSIDNPELDDQASREGLKENDAYKALQACVIAFLGWIEPFRYQFRERNRLGRPTPGSTRALIEKREKAFAALRDRATSVVRDEEDRQILFRLIERAEETSEKEQERFVEQTRLLHDTHALGLLARFVLHEGGNLSGTMDSGLNNLEYISRHNREKDPPRVIIANESLNTFDTSLLSMRDAMNRLDAMLDQLDPVTRPRSTRRSKVVVETIIRKVILVLTNDIQDAGIKVSIPPRGVHKVILWEADLFHAIYNLLHNSIYWVQHSKADKNRRIDVEVESIEANSGHHQLVIIVSDSGPGVNAKSAPAIFDLGYTEKTGGYGVGLFIAREAIERSSGTLELLNPGERGAQFQILLEEVK